MVAIAYSIIRMGWYHLAILGLTLSLPTAAGADWINFTGAQSAPTIAEIHVSDDHVRVVLEIFVGDIDTFSDLLPDDWIRRTGVEPPPIETRMQRFSSETFQIVADNNTRLLAERKVAAPRMRTERPNPFAGMINPSTMRPVSGPPEDKRILYAELIYPFDKRPESLTFVPPYDKNGIAAASIGFIVYHKGVPVLDYRFLSEAARMNLDWDDPWYTRFESRALKRWQESGVRTFIYVEPFEVRHETLVRVKDLAAWMDFKLSGNEYIEINEFDSIKQQAGDFLLNHSQVKIDGRQLRPILDRVSFVKTTMTRTYFIDQPERLLLNTAMLGVIVSYLTDQLPKKVTVDWGLFSERVKMIPIVTEDPAGPFPSYLTPDDPVLTWQNFLKTYQPPTVAATEVDKRISRINLPAASLVCLVLLLPAGFQIRNRKKRGQSVKFQVGGMAALAVFAVLLFPHANVSVGRPAVMAPMIESKQAMAIVESLLKNVYRSFDFREEADIYDRLATSVSGEVLETIYLQNRKSLVVTQAGGARAKVKEVTIQGVTVEPSVENPLAVVFHTNWTAMGTVGHWGHIHSRKNQYEANISVEPINGIWKITGLELLEEKRIDPYAKSQT